jgi:hypothetical protein
MLAGPPASGTPPYRMRQLAALLVVASITTGCESFDVLSPQRTGALIRTIQVGMSEEEVVAHLGKPQKQEARGDMKFLFYATPWQVAEKAKQRSPIAIKDGKIVGLGVSYLAKFEPASRFPWDAWVVQVSAEEARQIYYATAFSGD